MKTVKWDKPPVKNKFDKFEQMAKDHARQYDNVNDPLCYDGIKEEDGKPEAWFFDSKNCYYINCNFEFNYACSR